MSDETRAQVRQYDRRLLVIFASVMLAGALVLYIFDQRLDAVRESNRIGRSQLHELQAFKETSTLNCVANQKNTEAFNSFIGTLQALTLGSPLFTKAQKTQRISFYQLAKQPVPDCPQPPGALEPKTTPPPPPPTKGIKSR